MHMPVKASVVRYTASPASSAALRAKSHQQARVGLCLTLAKSALVGGAAGFGLHRSRSSLERLTGPWRGRMRCFCCRLSKFPGAKQALQGCTDSRKRVTNSLLAINSCVFAAQRASKGTVTQWGVKVRCKVTNPRNVLWL